jgi:hypothetical protein
MAYDSAELADLLRKHGGKYGTIYGAAGGGDIEAVKEFSAYVLYRLISTLRFP